MLFHDGNGALVSVNVQSGAKVKSHWPSLEFMYAYVLVKMFIRAHMKSNQIICKS
jgi:hypothetical protein